MQEPTRIHRFSSPEALADTPADLRLFAGREDELTQVFRLLQTANSLVIYGQPGVGRTSFLRAGVCPLLRERGFLPVPFSWQSGSEDQPFAGIAEGLRAAADAPVRRAAEKATKDAGWTLTSLFKATAGALTKAKRPVVILIDDFEFLFARYQAPQREAFVRELAELLLKRYPTEAGGTARSPWKEAPTLKLVISLNQAQLAFLDEFRDILPELLTRRLRLAAPNYAQSVQILRQGAAAALPGAACGPFALDDEIAQPLLAHARLRNPGPLDAGKELYDLFLLRLLAAHVERLMIEAEKPAAEGAEPAAGEGDEVGLAFDPAAIPKLLPELLLAYYQERMGQLEPRRRPAVQNLMEASLYGAISQEHGIPRRLLESQYGLAPELVERLAELRLLRETVANQAFAYTLWHDSLREGIRLIRRQRSRESLRRKGFAVVGLAACVALAFHLTPPEKLAGLPGEGASAKPSLREQYADQPDRLEAIIRLEAQAAPADPKPLWELAGLQEQQGRDAEALETLRAAEKISPPGNPLLLRRKTLILDRLGLATEADETRVQLLAALEQPQSEVAPAPDQKREVARLHSALGDSGARQGRVEEARSHYTKAIDAIVARGGTDDTSRAELAHLHTELGKLALSLEMTQEAASAFAKALEIVPDFGDALEGRALLNLRQGRDEAAAEDLAAILRKEPDNILANLAHAQALQQAGHYDEALKALEALAAKYPDNPSLALRIGHIFLFQGQRETALTSFNRTLELDPRNADALMARAQIFSEGGNMEGAIADYTKITELHPHQAKAFGNRGILYRKQGQADKALADYNKVLELEPNDAHIHYLRGNLFLDANRLEEALADFGKAAELDPKNARAFNNHGFVLSLLGRFKEAIVDFGKAIDLDPVYAEAYSNRGFAIYSDTQSTQALADFHRAIILDPENPHNFVNRGRYYLEILDYEPALKDFDKAVELDPENPEAYQFRSQVLTKLGQTDRANADAAKAASLANASTGS
jgi:tetratricopeptide (TPR) repeat protein